MDAAERTMTIAGLAREHAEAIQAIFDANDDLQERLTGLDTELVYDPEDDYFAVLMGPPTDATTESIANSILLRVDPETLKIVGLEIYDFERRRAQAPGGWAAMVEYWAPVVAALRAGEDPADALRSVVEGRSLRELVPA